MEKKITTKQLGDKGEQIAVDYLLARGYQLLAQNYRYKRAEVDLVVSKGDTIVFVEVKYRSGIAFGFPEEVVNESKKKLIRLAAENYVLDYQWENPIRFDIVAIVASSKKCDIHHFEDAF